MGSDRLPSLLRWGVMLGLALISIGVVATFTVGRGYYLERVGLLVIIATPVTFLILLILKSLREGDRVVGLLAAMTALVIALSVMLSMG